MAAITFDDFRYQGTEIDSLRRQIEDHRFVHAIMICGEPGTGKRTLAHLIAKALMCKAATGIPCGICSSCRLADSGEHPDITIVEKGAPLTSDTAKGRSTIPVDDIREIIRRCSQYSFEEGNRSVIFIDAENMTVQAQNCLLKILEEPPQNNYFILTSSHPDQLLTTVRSRCRPVKLMPWKTAYIYQTLLAAGTEQKTAEKAAAASCGSIGKAYALAEDSDYWLMREEVINAFFRNRKRSEVLQISGKLKDRKAESGKIFDILEDAVHILISVRLKAENNNALSEFPDEWQRFAVSAALERFAVLSDGIKEARKQSTYNVNFQAVVEQLLLLFTGECDLWVK